MPGWWRLEPEYEAIAAFGSQLMITDYGSVVHLATLADRLGMDANELGWVLGFVLEACQEGKLNSDDLDGLEPKWGDPRPMEALLQTLPTCGALARCWPRAHAVPPKKLGQWAIDMAVYTQDGTTPRGHDHRGRWSELLDTCLSANSTIESTFGGPQGEILGLEPVQDPFDPWRWPGPTRRWRAGGFLTTAWCSAASQATTQPTS
jgi:aldehyde:ferredoxin oxidoreductase